MGKWTYTKLAERYGKTRYGVSKRIKGRIQELIDAGGIIDDSGKETYLDDTCLKIIDQWYDYSPERAVAVLEDKQMASARDKIREQDEDIQKLRNEIERLRNEKEKLNNENKQVMVALLKAQEESKALLVEKSRADTLLIESNHAKEEVAREKAAKEAAEAKLSEVSNVAKQFQVEIAAVKGANETLQQVVHEQKAQADMLNGAIQAGVQRETALKAALESARNELEAEKSKSWWQKIFG